MVYFPLGNIAGKKCFSKPFFLILCLIHKKHGNSEGTFCWHPALQRDMLLCVCCCCPSTAALPQVCQHPREFPLQSALGFEPYISDRLRNGFIIPTAEGEDMKVGLWYSVFLRLQAEEAGLWRILLGQVSPIITKLAILKQNKDLFSTF